MPNPDGIGPRDMDAGGDLEVEAILGDKLSLAGETLFRVRWRDRGRESECVHPANVRCSYLRHLHLTCASNRLRNPARR